MSTDSSQNFSAHHLMAWLSPSFPIGAFSYSHGLEHAIHTGDVSGAEELRVWLETILAHGAAWNDVVVLCKAYEGDDVGALAAALAGSKERHLETMQMGAAFAKMATELLQTKISPAPLPVVLGHSASLAHVSLDELVPLYMHGFAANLISVGVRLIPIGQTEGQKVLQALFPLFERLGAKARQAGLEDLGAAALGSDIASMHHETMTTRIFRT